MKKIVLISLCLIFSLSSFAQKDKLTLVKDGKSDYVIVIPHDHSEWIKYSAELLQKDIYKVSNCLIPIVTDKEKPKKKEICISFSDRYDPDMMMLGYGYEVYTEGEKIYLDYAGFRTYDSMVRMNKVFGQSSFTIISQEFHNRRAIYIARKLDLDVVGYNAKDVTVYRGFKTKLREKFARVKMFIDIAINKKPKFLGEPIIIK